MRDVSKYRPQPQFAAAPVADFVGAAHSFDRNTPMQPLTIYRRMSDYF
jgi:hypothetical protein